MTYFLMNYEKGVNIFEHTKKAIDSFGGIQRIGLAFNETKDMHPSDISMLIDRDIRLNINEGQMPLMKYSTFLKRIAPTPLYCVTVSEIEVMMFPTIQGEFLSRNPEDFCELSEDLVFVRDKLMQTFWRYNADVVSFQGVYGHTWFTYQIEFSPHLLARQAKQGVGLATKLVLNSFADYFDEEVLVPSAR